MASISHELPSYAQERDFTCGVSCVRSVLHHLKELKFEEEVLAKKMDVIELGYTPSEAILKILEDYGLKTVASFDNTLNLLKKHINDGEILLVSFFDDEVGHYGLIKKIDNKTITLMDPWTAREGKDNTMSHEDFQRRWYCWAPLKEYRGYLIRIQAKS